MQLLRGNNSQAKRVGHIYLIRLCFGSAPVQKHLFDIFSIGSCSGRTFLG